MDLLRTAVVDITTLVATCRALKLSAIEREPALPRKLRNRLRRDIRRGTVAYIDVLARSRRGRVDDDLLDSCRLAAEQQMAHAVAHQESLRRVMASEAGSLDGLAAARQDLWRLAQMAIYLRVGTVTLRDSGGWIDADTARTLAGRLRRRFRKALVAYARATLRSKESKGRLIATARAAALAEIGKRGAAEAERLADLEADGDSTRTVIRRGVTKPLFDLALDWQRPSPRPAG